MGLAACGALVHRYIVIIGFVVAIWWSLLHFFFTAEKHNITYENSKQSGKLKYC
jgi:hypothetical protein